MKRLLLIVSVCLMGISLYAEGDKPLVVIHKSNGGYWAWLNLYNDILYTPSMDGVGPAMLECTGAGFSSCRVPRQNSYMMNFNGGGQSSTEFGLLVSDAINSIIEKSETNGQRGSLQGSDCKKIAVRNTTRGGFDTYFVQGAWKYNVYGEGTLEIYISKSDILSRRM